MWKCLTELMWRSVTQFILYVDLNHMSISAYFELRCNRTTYYIIKGELLFFPFLVLSKKRNHQVPFFPFEWYLYILKDVEDYADISRMVRIIFFILLSVGFSLAGVAALSSPLAVSSCSFGGWQGAHAQNFMDLTESQQSQCVLKNRHGFQNSYNEMNGNFGKSHPFSTCALAVTSSLACFDMLPRESVWPFSQGSWRPGPSECWRDI